MAGGSNWHPSAAGRPRNTKRMEGKPWQPSRGMGGMGVLIIMWDRPVSPSCLRCTFPFMRFTHTEPHVANHRPCHTALSATAAFISLDRGRSLERREKGASDHRSGQANDDERVGALGLLASNMPRRCCQSHPLIIHPTDANTMWKSYHTPPSGRKGSLMCTCRGQPGSAQFGGYVLPRTAHYFTSLSCMKRLLAEYMHASAVV